MKSQYFYKGVLALAILGLVSCKPSAESVNTVVPNKGNADFSRYIAVGNSLTSGYADGGLYLDGQKNSFPLMIAEQMKTVGGGSFSTPFFPDNQPNGSGHLQLTGFNANGTPKITMIPPDALRPGTAFFTKYTGDINNYGVPGIKLIHAEIQGYGTANPFYERMLTDATLYTPYLSFVTSKPFTFFSMWLGNNDILGYASSGGAGDVPTPKSAFTAEYNAVIAKLVQGGTGGSGAKGVVGTIPDVTATAYFQTVTLNTLLAAIHASPGGASVNTLYIVTGAGVTRPATAADLFTLTLSSDNVIGVPNSSGFPYGIDPRNPIASKYVLDKDEVAIVNDYVTSYNATIRSVAAAYGLAIMDANAMLKEYGAGKVVNGAAVSGAFITGNLFSLDGIHLTPMGYAITANGFINAINAKYGSSIPIVDVTKYRGVKFP
ncbi:G-D-S-L family lipolytic protein [Pedobacter sp. HMWF019]|uniref:G-D-S-L family lipolytic protein n=1 Tax=Pedobacter sp. HMWF019 TaxID=2056856 RepID=UPI000D35026E|nr:G-D-S-L family lipolytic protein [Pedobacter sp. HMWF019]PTS97176.1 G-D-S-L family lipolytic protein [Pedobacter sp. HMWF019]